MTTLSNEQLESLRTAAGQAGDLDQVRLCEVALGTIDASPRDRTIARAKCADVISATHAMIDDDDYAPGTEIQNDAAKCGYTPVLLADNGITGDRQLTLWDCGGDLAIDTNGGAVWQDSDPDGFATLLEEIEGAQ